MENGKASGDEEIGKQSKEEKKMFSLEKEIPTWVYEKAEDQETILFVYLLDDLVNTYDTQTDTEQSLKL